MIVIVQWLAIHSCPIKKTRHLAVAGFDCFMLAR